MALVWVIGLHNKALFFRSLGGFDDGSFRASVWVLACLENTNEGRVSIGLKDKTSVCSLLCEAEEFKTLSADKKNHL